MQEMPGGQLRFLDEIVITRGDDLDLAEAIKVKIGLPRYAGCEFLLNGDPATEAGEDNGARFVPFAPRRRARAACRCRRDQ